MKQMPPGHHRATRRGFTLLETLVALAIFVGAVATLSRLVTIGIEHAERAELEAVGLSIVESRFAELDGQWLQVTDSGTYPDEDHPDWEWTLDAQSTDVVGLVQVVVTASYIRPGPMAGLSVRLARLWLDAEAIRSNVDGSPSQASADDSGTEGESGAAGGGSSSSSPAGSEVPGLPSLDGIDLPNLPDLPDNFPSFDPEGP